MFNNWWVESMFNRRAAKVATSGIWDTVDSATLEEISRMFCLYTDEAELIVRRLLDWDILKLKVQPDGTPVYTISLQDSK